MPKIVHRPRIVIDITEEQRRLLTETLAFGEQRLIFQVIMHDVTTMLKEFGHDFVAFILRREFTYRTAVEDYIAYRRPTGPTMDFFREQRAVAVDSENS